MGFIILALFIAIPLIEIGLFIEVGGWIGGWSTVGLVVLTAIIGVSLVRTQGLQVLSRADVDLKQGIFPLDHAFDGICLLGAGALLLTPGFMTDALGFLLLVPGLRHLLRSRLALRAHMHTRTHATMHPGQPGTRQTHTVHGVEGIVIEGDFVEVSEAGNDDKDDAKADDQAPD